MKMILKALTAPAAKNEKVYTIFKNILNILNPCPCILPLKDNESNSEQYYIGQIINHVKPPSLSNLQFVVFNNESMLKVDHKP